MSARQWEARALGPDDLPEVLRLIAEEQVHPETQMVAQADDFVRGHIERGHHAIGAFDPSGALLGFGLMRLPPTAHAFWEAPLARVGGRPETTATNIFGIITPACRGLGIGTALLDLRVASARIRGAAHIVATTHPSNLAANKGLARLGFALLDEQRIYTPPVLRRLWCKDLRVETPRSTR